MKQLFFKISFIVAMAATACCCKANHGSAAHVVNAGTVSDEGVPFESDSIVAEFSSTTLIVMCDETVGKEPLRKALAQIGAEIIYDYSIINGMAVRKPESMTIEQTIQVLKQVQGVISVNRDRIHRLIDPVRPRVVDR